MRNVFKIAIFLLSIPSFVFLQGNGNGGHPGGIFQLPLTSTDTALRNLSLVWDSGIQSMHLNPASLPVFKHEFLVSYRRIVPANTSISYLAYMHSLKKPSIKVGGGFVYLDPIDLTRYDKWGHADGTTYSYENCGFLIGGSYTPFLDILGLSLLYKCSHASFDIDPDYEWNDKEISSSMNLYVPISSLRITNNFQIPLKVHITGNLRLVTQKKNFYDYQEGALGFKLRGVNSDNLTLDVGYICYRPLHKNLGSSTEYGFDLNCRPTNKCGFHLLLGYGKQFGINAATSLNINLGRNNSSILSPSCGFGTYIDDSMNSLLYEISYSYGYLGDDRRIPYRSVDKDDLERLLRGEYRTTDRFFRENEAICVDPYEITGLTILLDLAEESFIQARRSNWSKSYLEASYKYFQLAKQGNYQNWEGDDFIHYLQTLLFISDLEKDNFEKQKILCKAKEFADSVEAKNLIESQPFKSDWVITCFNINLLSDSCNYDTINNRINKLSPQILQERKFYFYWMAADSCPNTDFYTHILEAWYFWDRNKCPDLPCFYDSEKQEKKDVWMYLNEKLPVGSPYRIRLNNIKIYRHQAQ